MAHPDDPTDENVSFPWQRASSTPVPEVLHVVVAWFLDEPDRVGQAARIDRPCYLGRGEPTGSTENPVEFTEQRPGSSLAASALTSKAISRRQLVLDPVAKRLVRVQCVGRRALRHNGAPVTECVATAGDTLVLENTAVFLLEDRPPELPPLRHYPGAAFPFGEADPQGLVGESAAAWRLREQLAAAALSDGHVLVHGPSGVGKELAARVIHDLSARKAGPFLARNAATVPGGLLDAEIFGTARNYPHAGSPERQGLVGAAHGGTLMLDEIGELPEEHQVHLLRVLDKGGEYHRLGEAAARQSEFRLVGATNRPPATLKHDFLARFAARIRIPVLEERRSDIPLLIRALLARHAVRTPAVAERFFERGEAMRARLEPLLVEALVRHAYREETRELERLLLASIATSQTEYLALTAEVAAELHDSRPADAAVNAINEEEERAGLVAALEAEEGNVRRAAERLGTSRYAVYRMMRKFGLSE